MNDYDVLIIGAGAIGCSIARELSKFKLNTIVLEAFGDVSQGASKANSGIVHGGYDELNGTLKSRVAHQGNLMFDELDNDLNFGFRRVGSLVLAFDEEDMRVLERLLRNGRMNGVDGLEIIGRESVLELEPNCGENVIGGLYCPHTGITSPYEYVIALAENASFNGVSFRLESDVLGISKIGNQFEVNTLNGHYKSKLVINAVFILIGRIKSR